MCMYTTVTNSFWEPFHLSLTFEPEPQNPCLLKFPSQLLPTTGK